MSYTRLESVNRILRAIHEAPVAALDTGTSSVAGLAETYLDEADKEIQSEGWAVNTEYDVEITGADTTKLAMVIASGTWTVATLTLTKTAAFTSYTWAYGDQIYVSGGTGVTAGWYRIASRTSANAIVLATSIAAANNADTTTTIIGWDDGYAVPSDILSIDGYGGDSDLNLMNRGGMLYDPDEDSFDFGSAITVERIRQLSYITLPLSLQNYIVARASIEFQRRMTQGQVEDSFLQQEYERYKRKAFKEETETRDVRLLNDEHTMTILGQLRSRGR